MKAAEEAASRDYVRAQMERLRRTAFLYCRDWHTADEPPSCSEVVSSPTDDCGTVVGPQGPRIFDAGRRARDGVCVAQRLLLGSTRGIFLVEPDPVDDRTGTPATVGGNPAQVLVDDNRMAVHVRLPDGSELQVSASAAVGLDETQLLQIAEGVRITDTAVPFRAA